jgi:flagellar capping protein FliD
MSDIRLPGLFTGIDTNKLISQLIAAESRQLNLYKKRLNTWDEKKDSLSTLKSKLDALRSNIRGLSDANKLRSFKTASSDTDILTAEAAYNAFEGNHTVEINQLANAERWVHSDGQQYKEDLVGAGVFVYSYNNKETSITTTLGTTLEDLVGLINNDANNPGVTASLLNYNNKYHLVLSGNEAGTDYKVSVNPSNTEVWTMKNTLKVDGNNATMNTKITDLDQFSGSLTGGEHMHITGTDRYGNAIAQIAQIDLNVTANTKVMHLISEINDAFDGKAKAVLEDGKIVLTENNYGASEISINLSWDPDSVPPDSSLTLPDEEADWNITQGGTTSASLAGYAQDDFALTQAAFDSKIKIDGYPQTTPVAEVQTLTWSGQASAGHFHLTYNGQTTGEIAYGADLGTIQDALEALPNVSAGEITVGDDSDMLTVDSGSMTFGFTAPAGDVGMIAIDTSELTGLSNESFAETTKGDDGWIHRSSNTVNDVVPGVTLHLHDTGTVKVNLTRDIAAVKDKLNSMITAYNAMAAYVKEKTGYNNVLKTAGVLMGDYVVSTIKTQLATPLYSQTNGFIEDIDTFLTPGHIGLELDRNGMLSLDTAAFDEAIAEDYTDVLAIIGADKTGSSDSSTIKFYGASSNYTTAGTYDVKAKITNHQIEYAWIKLSTESTYRLATFTSGSNIITGNNTFNDNGAPVCPENGLQLSVDLSQDGTYGTDVNPVVVSVKQGFTGAMEDMLDKMLKATSGSIQIDQEYTGDQIKNLQDKINREEERLAKKEERLKLRFATLEKTLALLQNQMAALGLG